MRRVRHQRVYLLCNKAIICRRISNLVYCNIIFHLMQTCLPISSSFFSLSVSFSLLFPSLFVFLFSQPFRLCDWITEHTAYTILCFSIEISLGSKQYYWSQNMRLYVVIAPRVRHICITLKDRITCLIRVRTQCTALFRGKTFSMRIAQFQWRSFSFKFSSRSLIKQIENGEYRSVDRNANGYRFPNPRKKNIDSIWCSILVAAWSEKLKNYFKTKHIRFSNTQHMVCPNRIHRH